MTSIRNILYRILTVSVLLLATLHLSGQNSVDELGLRTVVIDPGHGGKDPGTPGPDRNNDEKHIVLKICHIFAFWTCYFK